MISFEGSLREPSIGGEDMDDEYSAESIQVLEGLEAVRKRLACTSAIHMMVQPYITAFGK